MPPDQPVTIATWNVFNRNIESSRIRRFVETSGADIIAFQELTVEHLQELQNVGGYELHIAEDCWEGRQIAHLAILTRFSASSVKRFLHNAERQVSPSRVGRRMAWVECIESLCVDVGIGGKAWRVVNLHLTCAASPSYRAARLEQALLHFEVATIEGPAIILGDFNSFGRPWLNWLLWRDYGFRAKELLVHELRQLNKQMSGYGLRSRSHALTFPQVRLVLDRIYARSAKLEELRVWKDTFGSDHRPIVARYLG